MSTIASRAKIFDITSNLPGSYCAAAFGTHRRLQTYSTTFGTT